MNELLKPFDAILLDMNDTFVFGGDRFSLTENYFRTYQNLGGETLLPDQVSRAINNVFNTLDLIAQTPDRYDDFPSIEETLSRLPESKTFSKAENRRLADVFACHEVGRVSTEYAKAIRMLSETHQLHLVSNIWSPKKRFIELLTEAGIAECFTSMIFSSDSRSVKPSTNLIRPILEKLTPETTLLIGDSLHCDVGLAHQTRLKSVWLSHGRTAPIESPQPDFVVHDLLTLVGQKQSGTHRVNAEQAAPIQTSIQSSIQIESETLRLRPTQECDLPFVMQAERDPDNAPFVANWSESQHRGSLHDKDTAHLIVEQLDSKKSGYVIIRGLASEQGPIELKRIVITEKGQGLGFATLAMLKELTFRRLNRPRLWLNVLPVNKRARRLYFNAGFRYEGTWRESFLVDGKFEDLELLTALASDDEAGRTFTHANQQFRVIRSLSTKHLQQYCSIYDQEWPNETRTHADLERGALGAEFIVGLVEESSNDLVGSCRVVSDRGFRAWIYGLVVRKDYRGKGVGKLLMDEVLGSKELNGIHNVSLTCAPSMNDFYRKWGFEVIENETVMTLPLRAN